MTTYELPTLILMIIQTVALVLAAGGALWYARDNRTIRNIMRAQISGARPILKVHRANNPATKYFEGRAVPEEISLLLSNPGPVEALDVDAKFKTNWSSETEQQYKPKLKPGGSTYLCLHDIAKKAKKFLAGGESYLLWFEIAIQYKDPQGKPYSYTCKQQYKPDTGWTVEEERGD